MRIHTEWHMRSGSKYGFPNLACSELEKATGCKIVQAPNPWIMGKYQVMVVSYKGKSQKMKLMRFCKRKKYEVVCARIMAKYLPAFVK